MKGKYLRRETSVEDKNRRRGLEIGERERNFWEGGEVG